MHKEKMIVVVVSLFTASALLVAQPQPGSVLWTFDERSGLSSPALAQDGTLYVSGSATFFAVTNSGSVASNKWVFPVAMLGSPAVAIDGTIYFGGQDGNLYALNPDGSQKWSYQAQGGGGSPGIGADNTIYFEGWGALYALSPSGAVKWKFSVPSGLGYSTTSPSLAPDGTIYIGSSYSSQLFALSSDGAQKWVYSFAHGMGDTAAIGADGTIYATSQDLFAIRPNGSNLWATSGSSFDGSPALSKNGTIYIGTDRSHYLTALSLTGQFQWAVLPQPSSSVSTTPAVDSSGNIYYCVSNGVWAVSPLGVILWTVTAPGDPGPGNYFAMTSPLIGPDGTIYAALGSKLYAIAGTNALGSTSWPMYRQNPRHTGKMERPTLGQPQKRIDNNFQFQMYPQQLGLTYTIESSTNLGIWASLTSFVATSLPMPVNDLSASNSLIKFYRAFSSP